MAKVATEAWLDWIEGIGRPKPKVIVKDNEVVRDADPHVSEVDPNYAGSDRGIVRVRRSPYVTVRIDLWEEQQRQKRLDRQRLREIDPFRLGHWSGGDE